MRNGICAALVLLLLTIALSGAAELMTLEDASDVSPAPTAVPVTATPAPSATPEPTAYLTIDQQDIELVKGKGVTLSVTGTNLPLNSKTKYMWSTSNTDVANVSDKGRLTGTGGGTCRVYCAVTIDGVSYTAQAEVTVLVSVTSIKARDDSISLVAGESTELVFNVRPTDASDMTYTLTSADPDTVRVNDDGTITALKAGTTTVKALAADGSGKNATTTVRVATLQPEEMDVTVSLRDGGGVYVRYLGNVSAFNRNITITNKSKLFTVEPEYDEGGFYLHITPLAVGEDTITLKDSKSSYTPVTMTIRVDNRLSAPTVPAVEAAELQGDALRVTLRNHGQENISAYSLRYAFYDEEGNQLFAGKSGKVDFAGEVISLDYMGTVPAGEGITVWEMLPPAYVEAVSFRAAVDGYTTVDGTRWAIPENSLRWVDSLAGEVDARGLAPETVALTTAETVPLGLTSMEMPAGFAEQYGFSHVGRWVTLLDPDGIAAAAGIKQSDLIFAADGVTWADNPFLLEEAAASIAAGNKVEIQVERSGKVVKVTVKK